MPGPLGFLDPLEGEEAARRRWSEVEADVLAGRPTGFVVDGAAAPWLLDRVGVWLDRRREKRPAWPSEILRLRRDALPSVKGPLRAGLVVVASLESGSEGDLGPLRDALGGRLYRATPPTLAVPRKVTPRKEKPQGIASSIARRLVTEAPLRLLLVGPPGSGKTALLAQLEDALSIPAFRFDSSTYAASAIEAAFLAASLAEASVVLVDDVERSFGSPRSALVAALDAGALAGVSVVATASDESRLGPDLARPDRFEEVHRLEWPTPAEVAGIMRARLESLGFRAPAVGESWAALMEGRSPAEAVALARQLAKNLGKRGPRREASADDIAEMVRSRFVQERERDEPLLYPEPVRVILKKEESYTPIGEPDLNDENPI